MQTFLPFCIELNSEFCSAMTEFKYHVSLTLTISEAFLFY